MQNELTILPEHKRHSRNFHEMTYVYPVLSRRSKGISIGVNLNPDKICNFDCIYCQVDRTVPATVKKVDIPLLLDELETLLRTVTSGELFDDPAFASVPEPLRRLNDIAFSGDGEPTTEPHFGEIVHQVAELKRRLGLDAVKLVVITNATMFHRPKVAAALDELMANQGEIWAKLDAGTEEYYQEIERTSVPLRRVLDNITNLAKCYPLVIQSMFLRHNNSPPSEAEIAAYVERLREVIAQGGTLQAVQVYTVARTPAESTVSSLCNEEVDRIAHTIHNGTAIPTESYYGS